MTDFMALTQEIAIEDKKKFFENLEISKIIYIFALLNKTIHYE